MRSLAVNAMLSKIHIENFKGFGTFDLDLDDTLNIVVGNNEAGKSSILEAISLVLTKRLGGRQIESELTAHLFNKDVVAAYVAAVQAGAKPPLPRILIEAFLTDSEAVRGLRGSNNHSKTDAIGIKLEIAFNDDYADEYTALLAKPGEIKTLPTEYYGVQWCSFAGGTITPRSIPVGLSYIDATTIRLQSGTDFYLQNIISSGLEPKERAALSVAYRNLKEQFSDQPAIKGINAKLTQRKGAITDKDLAITVDVSQRSNWESNLVPHLDDLPFQFIGKGEQSALKIMLALDRQAGDAHVILIEEPENHLSFASMQKLIQKIEERCAGKQIIITTHSAYVLNRLGLEKTILLHGGTTTSINKLPPDTEKYFKKLSGYDTLRIILADRSILVEGPSDELILQKAYLDRHGRLPSADGVDVVNVRGLSFPRFLDITRELKKPITIVTDNDGDYAKNITEKYKAYAGDPGITICADDDNDAPTLEPQMAKCNTLDAMNKALRTAYTDKDALVKYMSANKTEWALRVLETAEPLTFPDYVQRAL